MNRIRPIESTQKPMIRKCMFCHTEIDVAKGEGVRIRHNKEKYKTICCKCLEEVKMNRIRPIEIRKCMICHTEIDVAKGEGVRIRHNKEKYKTICGKCLDFAVKCAPIGIQARIYSNLRYRMEED